MGKEGNLRGSWAPAVAPPLDNQRDFDDTSSQWRRFDNSVNAISFGFVATAVLISMFLVMAIFERFLRTSSPERVQFSADVEAQMSIPGKLRFPSPKVPMNPREVSVLMPGDNIPSFIAQPAPVPCAPEMRAPERISRPPHRCINHANTSPHSSSSTSLSSSICEQVT